MLRRRENLHPAISPLFCVSGRRLRTGEERKRSQMSSVSVGKRGIRGFFWHICSTNLYDRAVLGPDPARPAREAVLETVI